MLRRISAILILLLWAGYTHAAARTTSRAGPWSDSDTWGGSTPPGNGDSATINHAVTVTADTTVGTSGAAGTVDVLVDATGGKTGALTINSGYTLTVRGDTQLADSVLTLGSGTGNATYKFGNGGSAQRYLIKLGNGASQTNTRVVSDQSTTRKTITKESSAGNGGIQRYTASSSVYGGVSLYSVDISSLGTSTFSTSTNAIECIPNGASQEFRLYDCTLTSSGALYTPSSVPANRNLNIQRTRIITPLNSLSSSTNVLLLTTAATTGERVFTDNGMKDSSVVFATSLGGFTIKNNQFGRWDYNSIITDFTASTEVRNNFISNPALQTLSLGLPGDTIYDTVYFANPATTQSVAIQGTSLASSSGNVTFDGLVMQQTLGSEETDAFIPPSGGTSGPWTYKLRRLITCLNSRGKPSMNGLSSHGNNKTSVDVEHCTAGTTDNSSPSSNAFFAHNHGATYIGHANFVASYKDNLIFSPATLSSYGWALTHFGSLTGPTPSGLHYGTADATSTTTTINCTGKSWPTTATEQFSASGGAKVVITVSGSGDPPVGEVRDVSSNTATSVTVSSPFSAAPDSGSCQFRVFVVDTIAAANADYNAMYNVRNGTVYDSNGSNGISKHGYEGMSCTSPSTIGTHDLDLGTGSGITSAGPKFVDPTRGPHNFTRYLLEQGLSSEPSAWVTSTSYSVGNRVKNSNASWFNNESLWYRCIAAHTSGSTTEPGVGASWRTNWEFDFLDIVNTQTAAAATITDSSLGLSSASYIKAMYTWVRAGWAPTNTALRNAAHDGTTPGAVEGQFPKGAWWYYINARNSLERFILAQSTPTLAILTER